MAQIALDNQAITQNTINVHFDKQAQRLAPDFEIDSVEDEDFGTLCRVWKNYHFLGSFYQNLDGKWVTQPSNTDCRQECDTEYQAQLVILAMLGLVVPIAA